MRSRRISAAALAAAGLVVSACGGGEAAPPTEASVTSSPEAPATYLGTLPCADCPGIDVTLTLLPDTTFRLRRVYQDRGPEAMGHELGRWAVAGDTLALFGGGQGPLRFTRFDDDSLTMRDREGRPIGSALDYTLRRSGSVDRVEEPHDLRGMMTYMADAARFVECRTGRSYAIAMEGDYLALEQAYLAGRTGPGEPLLAAFRGSLVVAEGMEGGPVPTVRVVRFDDVFPGEGCDDVPGAAPG